ncbi:S-adenosylmethionine:tRNA ribosyltransferase-isomerase [soil metagenome]
MEPILLADYHYHLPDELIANAPHEPRDHSRLLFYNKGEISHKRFDDLPKLLPADSLLVFNNSKVIPARMFFQRATGATIELLLLQPLAPAWVPLAMAACDQTTWECMVGNKKRWKPEETLTMILPGEVVLTAVWANRDLNHVELTWTGNQSLAEVLSICGELPLPPYLNRRAAATDSDTYQTVYSKEPGAVAAPTAGLHFSQRVIKDLEDKGIKTEHVTLHVGAGTFAPVKEADATKHQIHREQLVVSRDLIYRLMKQEGSVIAVGTTSLRVLESMYWFGVKRKLQLWEPGEPIHLYQYEPYELAKENIPVKDALRALEGMLEYAGVQQMAATTEIYIYLGYEFKIINGLVTNFHLPETTLVLLVAAFLGNDWRKVYNEALSERYRFLSYGDSSLLLV